MATLSVCTTTVSYIEDQDSSNGAAITGTAIVEMQPGQKVSDSLHFYVATRNNLIKLYKKNSITLIPYRMRLLIRLNYQNPEIKYGTVAAPIVKAIIYFIFH